MNFLGVGVAFSAIDKGLSLFLGKTDKEFSTLGSTMASLSETAGHFTSEGTNLTTQFEEMLISSHKTGKAMAASFGLSGAAIEDFAKRATDASIAMNLPVAETAEALRAFTRETKGFKAAGVDSFETLAKVQAVYGVKSQDLADVIHTLRKELGDEKALLAGPFIQAALDAGKATGNVTGMLGEAKNAVALMARAQALGIPNAKAYGTSIFGLSKVMFALGSGADEARSEALQMSEQLVASFEQFRGLRTGEQHDIAMFMEKIGVSLGDFQKTFTEMNKGPEGFLKGLLQIAANAKKTLGPGAALNSAIDFIGSKMESVLGPRLSAKIVNAFKAGTDPKTIEEAIRTMASTGENLGEAARKGFETGYTSQQLLQLTENQFITRFRRITGSEKQFLDTTRTAFSEAGDIIETMAKDEGPMGHLLQTMSKVNKEGMIGFLPENMKGTAVVLGQMGRQFASTISLLDQLGVSTLSISTPFKAALAVIGGTFTLFKVNEAKVRNEVVKGFYGPMGWGHYFDVQQEAHKRTVASIQNFVRNGVQSFLDFAHDVPNILDTVKQAFMGPHGIATMIEDAWKGLNRDGTVEKVKAFFNDVWEQVKKEYEGSEIQKFIGSMIDKAAKFLSDKLETAMSALFQAVRDAYVKFSREHTLEASLLTAMLGGMVAGPLGAIAGGAGTLLGGSANKAAYLVGLGRETNTLVGLSPEDKAELDAARQQQEMFDATKEGHANTVDAVQTSNDKLDTAISVLKDIRAQGYERTGRFRMDLDVNNLPSTATSSEATAFSSTGKPRTRS